MDPGATRRAAGVAAEVCEPPGGMVSIVSGMISVLFYILVEQDPNADVVGIELEASLA